MTELEGLLFTFAIGFALLWIAARAELVLYQRTTATDGDQSTQAANEAGQKANGQKARGQKAEGGR